MFPNTVLAEIDKQLLVPKLKPGLHLRSELQMQKHNLGTISLPGGGTGDTPNLLYAVHPKLDELTIEQFRNTELLPSDFRYVPLVIDGKLQYVKQLDPSVVAENDMHVIDFVDGGTFDIDAASRRFMLMERKSNPPLHSLLVANTTTDSELTIRLKRRGTTYMDPLWQGRSAHRVSRAHDTPVVESDAASATQSKQDQSDSTLGCWVQRDFRNGFHHAFVC